MASKRREKVEGTKGTSSGMPKIEPRVMLDYAPRPGDKLPSDIDQILNAFIASETYFEQQEAIRERQQKEADEDFEKMAELVEEMSRKDDAERMERNRLKREAAVAAAKLAEKKAAASAARDKASV